jgi:hypothetical protein
MNVDKQKKISNILQQFNRQTSQILKIIKIIEKNNIDVEWVQRILRILRNENPPLVLEKCIDKFWYNKEKIISRDTDFFINENKAYRNYIKDDDRKEWIEGIIDMIKKKQSLLTEEQRTYIWDRLNNMLQCIIEYRIIVGDFKV